ncbi:MAG TPA: DsrE/DsrF/DrsH-like family protein [Propionicimonas sp.]|mgnify:FL=1|nr:DsrE/DsrF/DrsH-like family protein [Propionicimonas sp.]HQA76757.1 DsrE/DsrF/DrsH-like family protein [Propionicimonas sp.]HQD96286.1 DsrE/DsrF/DrsH-like family protein [Propionicimonas sp.]
MTDAPIVPDFSGPDCPAPNAAPAQRKLVIICSKGNLDMAYPGLILGSAALGEGIETHLFFTFWGFDMITKGRMDDLKFTMLGNTAMHLTQAPGMPIPAMLGTLPGMTKMATKMMQKQIADLEIPTVPEMLEQIHEMGGHMWACRMSFDMMRLNEADLYEGVEAVISATDFMELSEGAQIIFI